TLLTQGTDQAIEGHGGNVTDHRTPFQAEPTMGGNQGLPSALGAHAAVAQDEMGQDSEHGFTRSTLHAPDGETAQSNSGIMGVTGQTTTAVTGRLVCELEANREDEGEDELDKRFGIAKELEVGG